MMKFNNTYSYLPNFFYSKVNPTPVQNPHFVAISDAAAKLINLNKQIILDTTLAIFSGQTVLPGSQPIAMAYAGHQFGVYVPQLGDGRALLLAEIVNNQSQKWDLHLKGSGKTPYSRFGDGRAVLRSCIREFLASEALHHLNIPTTRALCIVGSDTPVQRETIETAATLLRLSPSHIRFGTFEYCFYSGKPEWMKILLDYTINQYWPMWADKKERYEFFFQEVVKRTAQLIAQWQACGFAHGVMNTDNMSILGLTLDYGPFGFMERYQPQWICNHSDTHGRYAFDQQPIIGLWNLHCLANTLAEFISDAFAKNILQDYAKLFFNYYYNLMRNKLGFETTQHEDENIIAKLLTLLFQNQVDYTTFFRYLNRFHENPSQSSLIKFFPQTEAFSQWLMTYQTRIAMEPYDLSARIKKMDSVNPKYILRNYLAENAIAAATQGDFSEVNLLLDILTKPYDEQPQYEKYAQPPPADAAEIVVSCSS